MRVSDYMMLWLSFGVIVENLHWVESYIVLIIILFFIYLLLDSKR